MQYCKRCVYPIKAVNLLINNDGICSACKTFEKFENLPESFWKIRENKFEEIIEQIKKSNTSNYDCLIPVSGGKDSYFQTHIITKKYNLKPLLVTYHGNNFLPEGDENRDNMRHQFDADHIVWGPSVEVLKKLNRLCFKKFGDMNWQNHCGIMSAPITIAAKFEIPFYIFGEIPWDISGMYDPEDFAEFSAKNRHEHSLRGYEWYDLIKDEEEQLSEKDMIWAKYPTDREIIKTNIRGLYIGNYFKWDPNHHGQMVQEQYNWQKSRQPFERTYRQISNIDDRYENGIHDLLKFVKFGYGRCSDHASKDIRMGYMERDEAISLVKKHDHVISSDIYHWLKYVDMDYDSFWKIADTFRDPNVWRIKNNKWYKDNLWGEGSDYGEVYLNSKQREKYI
jgi:N-acetyl sugar amidotransferase